MSDPSYMLAQRIVPDLFWFSLVLAVILALTHRLRMPRDGWHGQRSMGQLLPGPTSRHHRPTWHGHH